MIEETPLFVSETHMTLDRQYKFNIANSIKVVVMFQIMLIVIGALFGWLFFRNDEFSLIFFCVLMGLVIVFWPLIHLALIKRNLRKSAKKSPLQDGNTVSNVSIYENNLNVTSTRLGETIGSSFLKYENLIKITQYRKLLIIYVGINQAYLLDGDYLIVGNFDDLLIFLKSKMGKKFKVFRKVK